MKKQLLNILLCPKCQSHFKLVNENIVNNEVKDGTLTCIKNNHSFEIYNYIPRLVYGYNYSDSWGLLWKETAHITMDSFTGIPFYKNALHGKWDERTSNNNNSVFGFNWPMKMPNVKILDVGPGTGCHTEHLIKTEAEIVSIDHSDAVDTFTEDMLLAPNINVIQADINSFPIKKNYFDRIWCFQVLQHTPKPLETLKILHKYLKANGLLSVTSYGGHTTKGGEFNPWYYKFTKRIPDKLSWKIIKNTFPLFILLRFSLQKFFAPLGMERLIRGFFHIFDPRDIYYGVRSGKMDNWIQGLLWNKYRDKKLLMDLVLLNTFDSITPQYTNNCKSNELMEEWLKKAEFKKSKVWGNSGVRANAIK